MFLCVTPFNNQKGQRVHRAQKKGKSRHYVILNNMRLHASNSNDFYFPKNTKKA